MLINGRETDCLDARDRGLHYGDGLFETVAVVNSHLRLWNRHLERLTEGCRRLGIAQPEERLLRKEAKRLCSNVERGVLKLVVTRGPGGRGYALPSQPMPTRVLQRLPWPDYPLDWWQEGVAIRICTTPCSDFPPLAGLKHLNRLEQVLARREWDDPMIAEGLLLNGAGEVIEGTKSNVFIAQGGKLLTPELTRSGVAGVMRAEVLAVAKKMGVETQVRPIPKELLGEADELFLTNALIGIWPVRSCGGLAFPYGPITHLLTNALTKQFDANA